VGAVVVRDGALLLVRRAQPPEAGHWSVPGGRVEAGETVRDALEREVREETGYVVRCGELVGWAERIDPGHHFVILDFAAEVAGGEALAGGDADQVAWVGLSQLSSVPLVTGLEDFLDDHGVR
jgi:8-oxo-dGTP diphosphatase